MLKNKYKLVFIAFIAITSFSILYKDVFAEGTGGSLVKGCDSLDTSSCVANAEVNTGAIQTGPGQSGGGGDVYVPDIDKTTNADKNAMVSGIQKTDNTADCGSWGLPKLGDTSYKMDTSGMTQYLSSLVDSKSYLKSIMPGNVNYCDGNNGRVPLPTPSGKTCPIVTSNITSSVVKDVDFTRNPHQWLWKTFKCNDGLFTNGRDGNYLKNGGTTNSLSCGSIYTEFPGLSNQFIQEKIIDAGYLDFLLDQKNAERIAEGKNPDTRAITERRKDLNTSAFKEGIMVPKSYFSGDWLTYTSEHANSSSFNMFFEPFYWYRLQSYANWHYKYTATTSFTWYEVVNGTDSGKYVWTGWNEGWHTPPSNVWAEAINNNVPRNANVSWSWDDSSSEKKCIEEKPDGGCKTYGPVSWHMIYTFTWDQKYTAILGPYTKTNKAIDNTSEETTGFMFMSESHDYEGVADLLENYSEGLCDYIPPEVTAKSCRSYYRGDGGFSNSDKKTLEKKCFCIEYSNLTD